MCLAATIRCVSVHSTPRNRFVSQTGLPYLEDGLRVFIRKFLDKRFRRALERMAEEGHRITIDDSVCELRRNLPAYPHERIGEYSGRSVKFQWLAPRMKRRYPPDRCRVASILAVSSRSICQLLWSNCVSEAGKVGINF